MKNVNAANVAGTIDVGIVGAGPGGLLAALAVRRTRPELKVKHWVSQDRVYTVYRPCNRLQGMWTLVKCPVNLQEPTAGTLSSLSSSQRYPKNKLSSQLIS